uniref:Uncharacterized protein n=1 Tax=Ananas comosus var. bracteatus TaxID=296719 RepID=A0A6V7P9G1_ANACO|nr:unnamed protein product [Ananas comosus var. bracteatus]
MNLCGWRKLIDWVEVDARRFVGTFVGENEGLRGDLRHEDRVLETMTMLACHLCSFAHACKGRSLQAGTPELAYVTYDRSCGIEKPTGAWRDRLIPRGGMLELPLALRRHKPDYLV